MIFGFNTDVKHDDTVYHVQSEAREADKLLQTQVFVRGRCIGKRAISYADQAARSWLHRSAERAELRDQHRLVLDSIREGSWTTFSTNARPETLAAIKELDVQWLNADSVHANRSLTMRLRVTEGGLAVMARA